MIEIRLTSKTPFTPLINAIVTLKRRALIRKAILALPSWLTPNAITWLRLVLLFPTLWLAYTGHWWWTFALVSVATFMDFLDGAVAEARNACSRLGAILDPIADKLWTVAILAMMMIAKHDDALIMATAGLMILIEIVIQYIRVYSQAKTNDPDAERVVITATWSGKMKMVFASIAISVLCLGLASGLTWVLVIGKIILSIAVVFGLFSIASKV